MLFRSKEKEIVDRKVENALLERAIGGVHEVRKTFKHISPSLPVFLSVYHTVLHLGIAIIADLQFQRSTRWQKCNSRRKTGIAFFHDKLISQPVEYNKK